MVISACFKFKRKPIDPATTSEKGMVTRFVKDLLGPFSGFNHVVYMGNYFTCGPLVEELAQDQIYVACTIKQRAVGFPEGLKRVKLPRVTMPRRHYVFEDRIGCVLLPARASEQGNVIGLVSVYIYAV